MTDDPELEAFLAFQKRAAKKPAEPTKLPWLQKEFLCLSCTEPFSRDDLKTNKGGSMISVKGCPFCKSDNVIRHTESEWAAAHKYDVSIETSILGPPSSKFARLSEKRMILSGKIKRK